ncbi:MAG: hypothetical protein HYU66_17810 [Armatimonadetes bacterium]|nr:hypothetical protein [Armatimonadota bacterium]
MKAQRARRPASDRLRYRPLAPMLTDEQGPLTPAVAFAQFGARHARLRKVDGPFARCRLFCRNIVVAVGFSWYAMCFVLAAVAVVVIGLQAREDLGFEPVPWRAIGLGVGWVVLVMTLVGAAVGWEGLAFDRRGIVRQRRRHEEILDYLVLAWRNSGVPADCFDISPEAAETVQREIHKRAQQGRLGETASASAISPVRGASADLAASGLSPVPDDRRRLVGTAETGDEEVTNG